MEIRELRTGERAAWLHLRCSLWPDADLEDLAHEQEEILADPARQGVLVAADAGGALIGFVEVALRDWAEGCLTRPVGYLEAWYVAPEHRRRGLGRRLVAAAERWVLDHGCSEMASDAELGNETSHRAHRALGYEEVVRLVLYRKRLTAPKNG